MKPGVSCFSILCWLSCTVGADAHVRWFVSDEEAASFHSDISNTDVATLLLLAALIVAFGVWLQKRVGPATALSITPMFRSWLRWAMALTLMVAAGSGYLVTPDHPFEEDRFDMVLRVAEALTGLALACNGMSGGWMLAALLGLSTMHDSDFCLDHIGTVGFALFFMLQGTRHERLAWPALRVCIGIDLVYVGMDEKLLHPSLALAFLHHFHWNFCPSLGLSWVTDELFVMMAGLAEVVIGAMLACNAFAPVCALAVITLMTVTAALLGPTEVAGHLPYVTFCVALVWQPQTLKLLSGLGRLAKAW